MKLYILRHADADTEASSDAARELSEKGREQAKKVAHFCALHGIRPEVVFSSPLTRAQQTAKPVAKELGIEITTASWLACGATPAEILAQLAPLKNVSSVILVGHQPDLGELIANLTGMEHDGSINVRKSSLTLLELLLPRSGGARIEFVIPVKMM